MNIKEEIKSLNINDLEIEKKLIRALNVVSKVKKTYSVEGTDFISPELESYLTSILNKFRDLEYQFYGGYNEAEYKVLFVYPDFISQVDYDEFLVMIQFKIPKNYEDISHPDVLGSLMGMGIVREKIGDINILDDKVQVICKMDIADYLKFNFTKVKRSKVDVEIKPLSDFLYVEPEFKILSGTVKSLRLDAVMSVGYGEARNKLVDAIKAGRVKVNHKYIESVSYTINQGDLISCRGRGRIILNEIGSKSKKDRIRVNIKKYI